MEILTKRPKRSEDTASRIIENEAVIVMPQEGLVRVLNEVGARIWELSDGCHAIGDIIGIIGSEFDARTEEVEGDVLDFIAQLREREMVVMND